MMRRSVNQRRLRIRNEKGVKSLVSDKDRLEVDRLTNLVRGFDWEIEKTEYTDEWIRVVVKKAPEGLPAEAAPGPG